MTEQIRIPWFHYFANRALQFLFPLLLRLRIEGMDNVPLSGGLIGAFNHTSWMDPVVVASFIRDDVLPMAKVELFRFPWNLVFGSYGAFAVRRGEGDLAALRQALAILKNGHVMLISPEGTRTKSGVMESAREGTALIASKSGAPILPIAIWGGKKFWTNLPRLRRTPVGVRIGEPLTVVLPPGKPSREVLRQVADEIMIYIARLLPEEYRGRYAEAAFVVPEYVIPVSQVGQASGSTSKKEVAAMR